jgi:D-arabinose 1-dehydrogenase-like Zn-dependent alcohol dehydrogenase
MRAFFISSCILLFDFSSKPQERTSFVPSVTGRAVQVPAAGGDFEVVQREFPEPGRGHVRIRVQACGVCHSDSVTKFGLFPGIAYPQVPGHEVAGVVDAVGANVPLVKPRPRVGLGWHGGHCNYCTPCRRGDFILCENQQISGISFDGGYADYTIAPANALALVPDDLSDVEAAPLICAGVTTYNSLRHSGARPGDLVAILGIGGLGHLGVQFAAGAVTEPWRLRAARTRLHWRSTWVPTHTSTARPRILPPSCRSWAGPR